MRYPTAMLGACLVLAALRPPLLAQTAPRAITLEDHARLAAVADPQRSPDGAWVAYTVTTANVEKDKRNTDVWMVRWDGSERVQLTSSEDGESSPRWSPDGKSLAFLASRGSEEDQKKGSQIWLLNRAGGEAQKVSDIKGGVSDIQWSPDSTRLAFVLSDEDPDEDPEKKEGWKRTTPPPIVIDRYAFKRDRDGYLRRLYDHIAVFDLASRTHKVLTSGQVDDASPTWSPDGTRLAFLSKRGHPEPDRTSNTDLWVIESREGASPIQVTSTPEGESGRLVKPAGYVAGRKYPTILLVHGGPNGQDEYDFDFEREFLAAQGYVLLAINYRGSSGRGATYQKAIYADWGRLEVMDLIGAVDEAIRQGVADPDRLGIGGWSYGGISTNYAMATDPRFKAAVSGAGSSMQFSMYGHDQYIVQYDQEMGQPWKAKEAWMKVSYPFFNAERIKTPTLFLGGEKDFNVPIAGGEQMYQALKSLGVPTELVIYPGQFHSLTVPSYERDRLQRYASWFNKYLLGASTGSASGR